MRQRFLHTCAAGFTFLCPFVLASGALLAGPTPTLCAATTCADPEPARVTLLTDDKQELVATYYAPIDTKQKAAAALLVHDTGGSRADMQPLALRLQKSGFAVLTLDLRGHGESANSDLTWKELDAEGQLRTWNAMPRDAKAGIDFLTSQSGVLASRVSLVSRGAGTGLIARHAVRDERVRDLVLIDPRTDANSNTLLKDLKQLNGVPTLVVVGKGELNAGKRLAEAAGRAAGAADGIEVKISKLESAQILSDKSMYGDVSRWMLEKSLPKKPRD